jgi:hypothetical protein
MFSQRAKEHKLVRPMKGHLSPENEKQLAIDFGFHSVIKARRSTSLLAKIAEKNYRSNSWRLMRKLFVVISLLLFVSCACQRNGTTVPATGQDIGQRIRVSREQVDASEPAIASSTEGDIYVAWVEHQGTQADVMTARVTNNLIQGTPVRVNPRAGVATAWRGDPPAITVASDGTVFVSWTARVESEAGHATNLYVSASRDRGHTFEEPVKVNDDTKPAVHGMHSLTVAKDGRIYVAWLDERDIVPVPAMEMKMKQGTSGHHVESNREVFISSSSDGGHNFSTNRRIATNACPCCKTALATSQDGRVYLSWRQVLPGDFRHIAVTASADGAQTFSEPKVVSDDQWMISGCPVSGSTMKVSDDGALHVLWYSAGKNGQTGLYSSESKDFGNSFDSRKLVAAGEISGTPVLLNAGAAVWEAPTGKITIRSQAQSGTSVITDGQLPAAVETRMNRVIAYVAKTDQRKSVWILTLKT